MRNYATHRVIRKTGIPVRLLDPRFKYTPSTSTNVVNTWRRFGYRPTTVGERQARLRRRESAVRQGESAVITRLEPNKQNTAAASALSVRCSADGLLAGQAPVAQFKVR